MKIPFFFWLCIPCVLNLLSENHIVSSQSSMVEFHENMDSLED